jgi:hypothetical protein
MIANYLPLAIDTHVPDIIVQLRKAFDDRLMDLYKQAMELLAVEPKGVSETIHVPFTACGLHVIAVFHEPTDHFTQLIARAENEHGLERPSFTISLFLAMIPAT